MKCYNLVGIAMYMMIVVIIVVMIVMIRLRRFITLPACVCEVLRPAGQ